MSKEGNTPTLGESQGSLDFGSEEEEMIEPEEKEAEERPHGVLSPEEWQEVIDETNKNPESRRDGYL